MNPSPNSLTVMKSHWLHRDKNQNIIETPEEAIRRIANAIASIEKKSKQEHWSNKFFDMMDSCKFFPNTPTWLGAGREKGILSACFVIPVGDSITEIFDAVKYGALIHQAGGGTGYSFGDIREADSVVNTSNGRASGPISFMSVFDAATETIKQGCFTGDILVSTIHGPIPIKDIKNGEYVYCYEDKFRIRKTTGSWLVKRNAEVWKLTTEKGLVFYATPEHKFLIRHSSNKKNYKKLKDLLPGTPLISLTKYNKINNRMITLHDGNDRVLSVEFSHHEDVYDMEVPEINNFVICREDGMKGLVVSNSVRRGANMGNLPVNHPDILQFVNCKKKEGDFHNFNISVLITDEFMHALNTNAKEFALISPATGQAIKTINPKELWDTIVESAWSNGEPGIIFIDNINKVNQVPGLGDIKATNPCWAFNTKIWTKYHGPMAIGNLVGKTVEVLSYNEDSSIEYRTMRNIRKTGSVNTLIEITLGNKKRLRCTSNHTFYLKDYIKIEAKDLQIGDRLFSCFNNNNSKIISGELIQNIQEINFDNSIDIYNGSVDGNHNYFVVTKDFGYGSYDSILSANCGEQPLFSYESCNLGSINIAKHLKNVVKTKVSASVIDYEALEETVNTAVRFLDNVIDVAHYPLPEIEKATKLTRKIGLGVMGFADTLIKLELPYDSKEALKLAEDLMMFINDKAFTTSVALAGERGVFPAIDKSIWANSDVKPRNATRTTIAPTGTISRGAGCSSGIEPLFAVCYIKHLDGGGTLTEINEELLKQLKKLELYENTELMNRIKNQGTLEDITEIPTYIRNIFKTSTELSPDAHLQMQRVFQLHVENAVSKTVNLPYSASIDDVSSIFKDAWTYGLKGITLYRTDSRDVQAMTLGIPTLEKSEEKDNVTLESDPVKLHQIQTSIQSTKTDIVSKRDKCLGGNTWKIKTGCGSLYVTINSNSKGPAEIFLNMGDSGGCAMAWSQALGKTLSLFMRNGGDATSLINKLRNIRCPQPVFTEDGKVFSCPSAVAIALEKELGNNGNSKKGYVRNQCAKCGGVMISEGSCATCNDCGASDCG